MRSTTAAIASLAPPSEALADYDAALALRARHKTPSTAAICF
jgi:hypothetical protein